MRHPRALLQSLLRMDMSPVSVCITPSVVAQVLVLTLLSYPVAMLLFSLWRRTPILGIVPVHLALIPILIGTAGAWVEIARVYEFTAFAHVGRASRAAGAAEAQVLVALGAVVGAVVSFVVYCRSVFSTRNALASPLLRRRRVSETIAFCLTVILVGGQFLASLHLAESHQRDSQDPFRLCLLAAALAFSCALGLFASFVHICRSPALVTAPRPVMSALMSAGAIALFVAAWRFAYWLGAIATTG